MSRRHLAFCGLLLLGVLAAYHQALRTPLNNDAGFLSYRNAFVVEPGHLRELLTSDFFAGTITGSSYSQGAGYYRPAANLLFWLEYRIAGRNPLLYNLDQLLIHWLNACLVLFSTLAVFGASLPAMLAAALFALHPINAYAATNPAARGDTLFCLFYLLALLAYARAQLAPEHGVATGALAAALLFTALALLSKEMAATLPAALVLLHLFWFYRRNAPLWRAVWTLPFWALLPAYYVWRFVVLGVPTQNVGYTSTFSPVVVYANVLKNVPIYVLRIIAPHGANYPELCPTLINYIDPTLTDPMIYASVLLLAILGVDVIMLRRRAPGNALVIALFLVTLSPLLAVNNISGTLSMQQILAQERWIYLPGVAVFVMLGRGGEWIYHRLQASAPGRIAAAATAMSICVLLGRLAAVHAANVENWFAVLRQYQLVPEERLSRLERANQLLLYSNLVAVPLGRFDDAEAHSRRAVEIAPDCPIAAVALANALAAQGKWDAVMQAVERWAEPSAQWLEEQHRTNPRVIDDLHRSNAALAFFFGRALAHDGRGREAAEALCVALQRDFDQNAIAKGIKEAYALNGPTHCLAAPDPSACVASVGDLNLPEWTPPLNATACATWPVRFGPS